MKSNRHAHCRRDSSVFLLAVALVAVASTWVIQSAKAMDVNSSEVRQNGDSVLLASKGSLASQLMMQQNEERDLIVGGKESKPEDFPYYVHLGGCGGSLIAPSVVLTAAHCGDLKDISPVVGCHEYGVPTGDAVERKVVKQVIHPDFDEEAYYRDFNLLLLDEPVKLEDHTDIQLELNLDDLIPADGQKVTVLGLGNLEADGKSAKKVRFVEVRKTADEDCKRAYGETVEDSVQFCAGVEEGGKDACQGDSGGPLVVMHGKKHSQVGVVSFGTGCAEAEYPGNYARVSGEMEWIRSVVCDEWEQTDAPFCASSSQAMTGRSFGGPQSMLPEWFRIESKGLHLEKDKTTPYCLSLEHGRVATNGEKLVMLPCDGTTQQQWTQFDNDFFIRSKMNPNRCIRVAPSTDTLLMELYDCFNPMLDPFEGYSDGTIRLRDDPSKCWDISAAEEETPELSLIDCSFDDNTSTQKWKTSYRKDDFVRTKTAVKEVLVAKSGEESVQSKHHHKKSPAAKHQIEPETRDYEESSTSATHVPHEPRDDRNSWFGLRNLNTDTCLSLKDGEIADLTLLVLEDCDDDDLTMAQIWRWSNIGQLQSRVNPMKCVVPSGDASIGSPMMAYDCWDSNIFGEWNIPALEEDEEDNERIGPILSGEDSSKCLAGHIADPVVTLASCLEGHIRNDYRLWVVV